MSCRDQLYGTECGAVRPRGFAIVARKSVQQAKDTAPADCGNTAAFAASSPQRADGADRTTR
jgi:hypothetical protein